MIKLLHPQPRECPSLEKRKLKITYYTNRVEETDSTPNITATGTKVREGIVGVSRDLLKQGWTHGKYIYVANEGIYRIEDTMNAKHKQSIDIFTFSLKHAKTKGTFKTDVILIDDPSKLLKYGYYVNIGEYYYAKTKTYN